MTSPTGAGAPSTLMQAEAAEAGTAVARFLAHNRKALGDLGQRLRAAPPTLVVTCARGSSDHAATYAKYLIETGLGVPTVSAAFSTVSLYDAPAGTAGSLCLAISQSGRSPDMLATVERQKAAGALVVALVNDEASPLTALADVVLPLCAGPERSVAATKSYITSLAGIAALVAVWRADAGLEQAIWACPRSSTKPSRWTGPRWRRGWSRPPAFSSSRVASAWRWLRRRRSSSRKPPACMPRPSAPPRCATAPWRWCARASR
jgi:glucosamine--fructose-6-phosphate aminotransferase (isomerizing)